MNLHSIIKFDDHCRLTFVLLNVLEFMFKTEDVTICHNAIMSCCVISLLCSPPGCAAV